MFLLHPLQPIGVNGPGKLGGYVINIHDGKFQNSNSKRQIPNSERQIPKIKFQIPKGQTPNIP
jgi:hypothetical protein